MNFMSLSQACKTAILGLQWEVSVSCGGYAMKTQRLRNSTKRKLIYFSVVLLYILVFTGILYEKPVNYPTSAVSAGRRPG